MCKYKYKMPKGAKGANIARAHCVFVVNKLNKCTLKLILCASEHICTIVRYCFRSFKQL